MSHNLTHRCHNSIFPYLAHSYVVIHCESARPCRTGEKEGDESDPPQSGGACDPDSGTESHTAIRPHAGRSRPYLSLLEGSESAPRRGAERRETDL